MTSSPAPTVAAYLASLAPDRRAALTAVRAVIRKNLPRGFAEGMLYGMIGYFIPLADYPDTYNGQPLCIAGLASQKRHMAVYLMGVYGDPATARWFAGEYGKSGKKLDMGKSCLRFRSIDDVALDVVGKTIARVPPAALIAAHEAAHGALRRGKAKAGPARAKPARAKSAAAKPATTATPVARKRAPAARR
jgi:hypothetical protein